MEDLSETVGTYESVADEYADRHGDRSVVEDQRERFLDALESTSDPETATEPRPRILDAGCGPGWEAAAFAGRGCSVLAIDLARPFLGRTRERLESIEARRDPLRGVARMDMRRLGVRADALDGIWACASFLHVPREEAPGTLAAFARTLRPGGVLDLAVKRGSGVRASDAYEGDDRRFVLYEVDEIRTFVEDAGFEVEHLHTDEAIEEPWIVVLART